MNKRKPKVPKDIQRAIEIFPHIVSRNRLVGARRQRLLETAFIPLAKKVRKEVNNRSRTAIKKLEPTKYHSWRLCPPGQHWVNEHPLTIPPSKSKPRGGVTTRRGHCHGNPSHRDQLYPDEMNEMRNLYFSALNGLPNKDPSGRSERDQYDNLIRGWTQYWNEVFNPKEALDPNLVKALIATESDFNPKADTRAKGFGRARGLMQVTDGTRKILKDEKGELQDRFVNVNDNQAYDPNLSIASGIRWLFQKKKLAETKLGREASWEEAVLEYKSYLKEYQELKMMPLNQKRSKRQKDAQQQIEKFLSYYGKLKS